MLSPRLALVVLASLAALACAPSSQSPAGPGASPLLVIQADAPTNASACEDRLSFAVETIEDVAERANGECSQDADCTLVFTSTSCRGACEAPILASNLDAFVRAQQAIDERACTHYMEDGCSYATPRCMQMRAVCQEQRCAMTPVVVDEAS
jgi:hypothetical protein